MHFLVDVQLVGDAELVADTLWRFGAEGLEDQGSFLRAAFSREDLAHQAAQAVDGQVLAVDDHTGFDAWRDHARAVSAGGFTIAPAWTTSADNTTLAIDPGRQFGSGSHPSTRLALDLLADTVTHDSRVADLGAGSGVLAIAAARLGAVVVAFEQDPDADAVITANAIRNQVADQITVQVGDLVETAPAIADADLAVLNVTIDLHEHLAPYLNPFLPNQLIVAGLLAGEQEARAACAHHGEVISRKTDGEWVALLLNRPGRQPNSSTPAGAS